MKHSAFFGLIIALTPSLQTAMVADASFSFPAQTQYVENDNLTELRKLPSYNTLRQNFSGRPLEEAKAVLGQLGVQEDQVQEIVTGSDSAAFYRLVAGTSSSDAIKRTDGPNGTR